MSSSSPRVTVVTPLYNQRIAYLDEAAESVFNQSDDSWRWLIADNHSDETVAKWLNEHEADPRIRIVRREQNLGLFPNLNDALGRVDTEFALGLCSDDRLARHSVRDFLNLSRDFPAADLFLASATGIDEAGQARQSTHGAHRLRTTQSSRMLPRKEALEILLHFGSINGSFTGMFFKSELFARIGPFCLDLPQAADWEWIYRAAKGGSIVLSNENVAELRAHAGQLSNGYSGGGQAARDFGAMTRTLLADPELRDHPQARRWALYLMEHSAWQATRAALRGDLALAGQIAREIEATTGAMSTFAAMVGRFPARLRAKLTGQPRTPPA